MTTPTDPPVARYRYTLTITGNTLEEVENVLLAQARWGFLRDSDGYRRDQWEAWAGESTRTMEHLNPEMTPERYRDELLAWANARRAERGAR